MTAATLPTPLSDATMQDRRGAGDDRDREPPSHAGWGVLDLPRSFWLGVFVAVFGVLLLASGLRGDLMQRRLETAGVTTMATVTHKQVRTLSEIETRFTVRTVFTDRSGATHERAEDVPYSRYRRLQAGSQFPIVYDPAHPSRALPADDLARSGQPAPWLIAGILLVLSGAAFACTGLATRWHEDMASRGDRRTMLRLPGASLRRDQA